jgi:hypothetical protein
VIGFSREQAQQLMNDLDAHTFMTQTRKPSTNQLLRFLKGLKRAKKGN